MKKLTSFLLSILMIIFVTASGASALFDSGSVTSQLKSDIYYLENLDEGTVLFEKDSSKKTPAAGFIKIIAAIVALEKWGNLDGSVRITEKNLNIFEYEYGMTTAIYEAGETVSKRELFDCLVVYSANDALSVIAYETSGSLEAFIAEMQNLVKKIGCTSTVVKNIHGFDEEGQYTTAQDVAKIIKYALQYPAFNEAFSASEVTLKKTKLNDERTYESSNKMKNASIADYYHSSVTGGKQTSTDLAGQCIAVVSNADGYSYLTVVMGGEMTDIDADYYNENTSMTDTQKMLDWVYENIRYKVIATPEQTVTSVDVVAGQGSEKLRLVPEKETSALVPAKVTPASVMFEVIEKPDDIIAPVKEGDIITTANVYFAGQKLTTINLVAAESVKLSFAGLVSSAFRAVVGSVVFLVITFILAFTAVLKFILDLKDFLDKDRRKSYDPLPSSFEVLTEKVKKLFIVPKNRKRKKKSGVKPKSKPAAKRAPSSKDAPAVKPVGEGTVKKSPAKKAPTKAPVRKSKAPEKKRPAAKKPTTVKRTENKVNRK